MIRLLKYVAIIIIVATNTSFTCKNEVFTEISVPKKQDIIDEKPPQNIILMIGDGMGVSQLYAGMTVNKGKLNIEQCQYIGFSKTYSADNYITDSAAGGTALSCGKKTNNGFLAVTPNKEFLPTILEICEKQGLATGLVSTSAITHATPASFIAHVADRGSYEEIATWFLKTDIDVFIGGGKNHFENRSDGKNLTEELRKKNYQVLFNMDEIKKVSSGKLAGLTAPEHNPSIADGRGNMLPDAAMTAINILKNNKKGFFLMIEGSQIDWGGHANNKDYVTNEVIDFDNTIGRILEFAQNDGNTLVIITADHETGGMSLTGGNISEGKVDATFTVTGHTGVMVPVYSYGPYSNLFAGIFENTSIFNKMIEAYGFSK